MNARDAVVRTLVEIGDALDTEHRARLLAAAYRASHSGRVGVVLGEMTPETADRLLDPVVKGTGIDVAGLVYLHGDAEAVLAAAGSAELVVATSSGLKGRLSERGISSVGVGEARDALRGLAERNGSPSSGGRLGSGPLGIGTRDSSSRAARAGTPGRRDPEDA